MGTGGVPSNQALGAIEAPDMWASMGRGITDVYQPVNQAYLNLLSSPAAAAAYRQQRAQDEQLYMRGLLGRAPTPQDMKFKMNMDPWRMAGQGLPTAPLLALAPEAAALTPEALASWGLTGSAYEALERLARKSGLTE
jgi:hypothetical protein